MWELIGMAIIAGIAGTALGGLIGALFRGTSDRTLSGVLAAGAGVMLGMVCFELFPESKEQGGMLPLLLSAVCGVILLLVIDRIADAKERAPEPQTDAGSHAMLRVGIVLILALAVHNVPEGFALGAGMRADGTLGWKLVLLIALHNIPDGMAIAVSLILGGMKKWQAVLLTALSGIPTVIGGMLGYWLGGLSPTVISVALAAAGGALLYVTFHEMLPQSFRMEKGWVPAVCTAFGLLLSMSVAAVAL